MNNNSYSRAIYFFIVTFSIVLMGCQKEINNDKDCLKFIAEQYFEGEIDSALQKMADESHTRLLGKFGEKSIKGEKYELYNFLFYSAHGYGKLIKFEKASTNYFLSVKCSTKKDWFTECENYRVIISEEEWSQFEEMIYEFNFWTEEPFRVSEGVLDGTTFFLEGNRPIANKCNKKTYKLVGRGSPRYDKIGALFDYILEYENRLAHRYSRRIR